MEKNGKPTMKCLKEHEWEEVSVVVYTQPDDSITREYTGIEGEYSRLYRKCKRCGEPQIRDWQLITPSKLYVNKPNPPILDQHNYMKKLKEKFE